MTTLPFTQFGADLALANRGRTRLDHVSAQSMQNTLDSAEGDIFHREVCKIAAAVYNATGHGHTMHGQLFVKLASAPKWCEAYNRFVAPVVVALGRYVEREETHVKQAAAAALLPVAADKAGVPSVVKLLLGLGAVGGVGAGSLGFLLSRDARQASAENNALLEKTRAYNQLRLDIDEDLAASGATAAAAPKSPQRYSL